jgi:uncharacterized protein (TIGR00730 family)
MTKRPPKDPRSKVPAPAHPVRRREPLPWQQPKSTQDDAEALRRVQEIMNSSSYQMGIADPEFLSGAEARGVHLEVDYLKADALLKQHNIEQTIVVFGSTRICEAPMARRRVEALRAAASADAGNSKLKRQLAIAERVLAKSHYYDVAREFGRLVSKANRDLNGGHTVIMTGGGPGIMEAANRGAFDVGAETVGLNIRLPQEQYPNPYISTDLCFSFHYFAIRKLHFLLRAKALVAFPGGYGTFDEVFEVLTLIQTRKIKPIPVVLVGEAYWRRAFDVEFLVDEGVIDLEDCELFWFAETADEIWSGILDWYRASADSVPIGGN